MKSNLMNYKFRINGQVLTEAEHSLFNNFLLGVQTKSNTRLIYRGESIINLKEKLDIGLHEDLFQKLNYFIFRIGEKGRVYQERYFSKLKSRSVFSISDTTTRFSKYIFKKINHTILNSKDPEILKFNAANKNFVDFFTDKKNSKDFVSKIESFANKEQKQVRDYYLTFLHRVGCLGFYLNTFLLSTTLSKKVANRFTTEEDIIFVSWRTFDTNRQLQLIKQHQLPHYKKIIFSRQQEVSIYGGLFPQDIIGFIQKDKNIFHINPNIFNYPLLVDYMITNGIPVDQTDFMAVLSRTNHSGFFIQEGDEITDNL